MSNLIDITLTASERAAIKWARTDQTKAMAMAKAIRRIANDDPEIIREIMAALRHALELRKRH